MKVLILGCGFTGSRLAQFLVNRGVAVGVTTREGIAPPNLDVPCYAFCANAQADPILPPPNALTGVTHVLNSIPPDAQGRDPAIAWLLHQLEALGLQWFGYLSTTGVYGDTQGAWVSETTPVNPTNLRSQQRVDIETALLQSKLPAHIFRLPGIYGPGRSTFNQLRAGTARCIDKPGHVFCRIHVDDIVQTIWASMLRPDPNTIYNVSDDEPTEPCHLIVEAAHLLGITPPAAIPFEQAKPTMSAMSASFWRESRRVSNVKIKTELTVALQYPTYREGLRAILQEEAANYS